jgi:general stress protein 26
MEIKYTILEQEIIQFLDDHKILILATSANDRVTARSMSCINIGLTIYFQTDKRFIKFEQIKQNPKVALCAGNLQIEGIAEIGNHSLDPSNKEFIELYKINHPDAFKNYSHLENNVVIKVEPTLITLWKYSDGRKPYREFLYIRYHKAEREYYV